MKSVNCHAVQEDYIIHRGLSEVRSDYNVLSATVISNERKVYQDGKVIYMPVYFVMFMEAGAPKAEEADYIF